MHDFLSIFGQTTAVLSALVVVAAVAYGAYLGLRQLVRRLRAQKLEAPPAVTPEPEPTVAEGHERPWKELPEAAKKAAWAHFHQKQRDAFEKALAEGRVKREE